MDAADRAAWARRLRPIVVDEPIGPQVAREWRKQAVGSGLLLGFALFFLAIFAGFGRPDIGARVAIVPFGAFALTWLRFFRLKAHVSAYRRAVAGRD